MSIKNNEEKPMIKFGEQERKFDTQRTQYKALKLLAGLGKGRVLDCGSGLGETSLLMRRMGFDMACIDGNTAFIEQVQTRGLEGYTVNLEHERLPFADNSFDGVISLETIEHISDVDNLFDEITRALKPGSWLIISTPNSDYWVNRLKKIFGLLSHLEDPRHHRSYSASSLKEELKKRGFTVVSHLAIFNIPRTKISFTTKLFPGLLAMQIAYKCVCK